MATRQAGKVEVAVTANLDQYTRGLDDAERQARDFGQEAVKATQPVTTATQQVTQAVAGLAKQGQASGAIMGAFNTAMNTFRTVAQSTLGPLAGLIGLGGLAGVAYAANNAITAFGHFEQQQMAFEGLLRATNNGLGVTGERLNEISQAVSRDTLTPIETLRGAFLQLGRDGLVVGENLERSIRILPDLAVRVGGFTQAITLLTQALQWPGKAMDVMRQAGIRLNTQQQESLHTSGLWADNIAHQTDVLRILEDSIGGEGNQQGSGVTGAFTRLANATQDLFVNFGGVISRFLGVADSTKAMAQAFEELNRFLFPTTTQDRISSMDAQISALEETIRRLADPANTAGLADLWRQLQSFGEVFRSFMNLQQTPIDMNRLLGGGSGPEAVAALQRTVERLRQIREAEALLHSYAEAEAYAAGNASQLEAHTRGVQQAIDELTGKLWNMQQSVSRADLATRQWAQSQGLAMDDARVREYGRLLREIEVQQRRLAQAGRPGPLELENERIKEQTELLRFNSQERQVQQEILRVSLQLQRRGQELEPEDRKNLEERIRLMRELQRATAVVEEAATSVFSNIGNAIADFAAKGKFDFHQLAESIIRDLVRIALQAYVTRPLVQAITGFTNPMLSSAYGVNVGTSIGTAYMSTGPTAAGGSFMIPGNGGGDRPSLLLGLAPGERVDVTPAGQAKGGGGAGVMIVNHINSSKDMQVEQRERTGPGGQKIVDQVFTEVMKRFGRGDADQTMAARFGVRSRVIQR